jgi:hypothetical protein
MCKGLDLKTRGLPAPGVAAGAMGYLERTRQREVSAAQGAPREHEREDERDANRFVG